MNVLAQSRRSEAELAAPLERTVESDRLDLWRIVAALRRRARLFGGIAGAFIIAAVGYSVLATPTYTATARVMINTRQVSAQPDTAKDVLGQLPDDGSQVDSEVQLIQSKNIAGDVVKRLRLDKDPEFNGTSADLITGAKDAIKGMLSSLLPRKGVVDGSPGELASASVSGVLGSLTVERVNTTNAIDIDFTDADPEKAVRIANAFADAYIADQYESKFTANHDVSDAIASKIGQLRDQALADQGRLQDYRIKHNLLATSDSNGVDTGAAIAAQEISTYEQQVATSRAQLAEDEAALNTARQQIGHGSKGDDLAEALGSSVIIGLRAQRAETSATVANLSSQYGPKYPKLVQAQQQLAAIDGQIQDEINRIISNLQAKVNASANRLGSLQGTLGAAKGTLVQNNAAMASLAALQQAADVSKQNYEAYLSRYNQLQAQQGMQTPDARKISNAGVNDVVKHPNLLLDTLLGLALGVAIGGASVFIANALDSSFVTADDVEERLKLPFLAAIPLSTSVKDAGSQSPIDMVVSSPLSVYAEAFRGLRASLGVGPGNPCRIVAVTSALPHEGKTTTAVCLARSAALNGLRVLLIDCDFRQRSVAMALKAEALHGVADVLTGASTFKEARYVDQDTGLSVLFAKRSEFTAEEAFGGDRMEDFLSQLKADFDLIVLDTPPLLPVVDTRLLAPKADQVVFVARWRKTPEPAIRAALNLLPLAPGQMLGVALTQVDVREQSKYGYGDALYYFRKYEKYYA
jgi:polysaccharide biosynthesis transport protein